MAVSAHGKQTSTQFYDAQTRFYAALFRTQDPHNPCAEVQSRPHESFLKDFQAVTADPLVCVSNHHACVKGVCHPKPCYSTGKQIPLLDGEKNFFPRETFSSV